MKSTEGGKKQTVLSILFQNKRMNVVFVLSTIIVAIAAPFKSYITQWLIDAGSIQAAMRSLALGIVIILISHITEYISRQSFARMSTDGVEAIRSRIMEKQSRLSMEEYLSGSTGSVLSGLTNDMRALFDEYYMSIFDILFWGGMLIVATIMLVSIAPVIAVITLAFSVIPVAVPRLMAKGMAQARKEYSQDISAYTSRTSDLLKGFEALTAAGSMDYFRKAHAQAADSNRQKEHALRHRMNTASVLTSLAAWIPNMSILLVAVILVFNGRITIGYLVTANSLATFVLSPCRMVADRYVKLKSSQPIKNKLEEMMREEDVDKSGTEELREVISVRFENVRFTYPGAKSETLHGVDLALKKGEKLALVGVSGSGKSTIVKLLYRYYQEYQGSVQVNGKEAGAYTKDSYYQRVAMLPQTPFIFNDTIFNNICLYRQYSEEEVQRAIRLSGLEEYVREQPDGLNTVLTENGGNLSGGQAQRMAIARALVRGCDVLLVDEATSSLDVVTTEQIMRNLLQLDCSVIVITHDIFGDYMKDFDYIAYLEEGTIREEGSFEEMLKRDGSFTQLYHLMASQEKAAD